MEFTLVMILIKVIINNVHMNLIDREKIEQTTIAKGTACI